MQYLEALESENAELRAEIERLRLQARQRDAVLDRPIHEVRTALNAVTGFASILGDEIPGVLNPRQQEYVGQILTGADRVLRLVNTLVDLAALESGTFMLECRETPYDQLVEQVLQPYRALAEHKMIRLRSEIDVPSAPWLDGPRVALILSNLVSNALRYNPVGGTVGVKAYVQGDELITEVSDGGPGLYAEDVARLLEPRPLLEQPEERGPGLGLTLARRLVEAHGGRLSIESKPGEGAKFWFALPRALPFLVELTPQAA